MRNYWLLILTLALFSCSAEDKELDDKIVVSDTTYRVSLSVQSRGINTLSSYTVGDTVANESWEEKINKLAVVLYYPTDNKVVGPFQYSPSEIENQPLVLDVVTFPSDGVCQCYVLANTNVPVTVNSPSDLQTMLTGVTDYNGEYAQVSTSALRTGGFVMSGMVSQTLNQLNKSIEVSLDKTVAKVQLNLNVASDFSDNWKGKLSLDNVVVSQTASSTPLFPQLESSATTTYDATYSQTLFKSAKGWDGLYYIYGNEAKEEYRRVLLEVNGTYVNTAGTGRAVTYLIYLNGNMAEGVATGEISRNKLYIVEGTICGLGALDLIVKVEVLDWEKGSNTDIHYNN